MHSSKGLYHENLIIPPDLKPIETKKCAEKEVESKMAADIGRKSSTCSSSSSSRPSEPLSPAARLFHAPRFNCFIVAAIGCKTRINPSIIKMGLEQTLIKHPRFSRKLVIDDHKCCKKKKWELTEVNVDNHVIVPDLDPDMDSPDQFVEDYISNLPTIPMDFSQPLWELHILNVKTSDAEAVAVFRIHHSLGDGASLISLLLACTRKTSDPDALPSVPAQKRAGSNATSGGFWWFFLAIWMVLSMIWNTFIDLNLFMATLCFLKDTNTPLKSPYGVERRRPKRFVHRTVSMDDIKLVKNAMKVTINDVLMGITQAGLSQYLNRKYGEIDKDEEANQEKINLPKNIRLRATVLVNVRPTPGIQDLADLMSKDSKTTKWGWGNWIGYIILPLTIALQNDPLDYVRRAKANIDRKKRSLEAICTFQTAILVIKLFGAKVSAFIASTVLSNTTFAFSNVVGPLEEISFCGHSVAYIAPSVYGNPQALTVHFQSYASKMTIVLAVDPEVIPDPQKLCDDLQDSLKIIKDAALERGLGPS